MIIISVLSVSSNWLHTAKQHRQQLWVGHSIRVTQKSSSSQLKGGGEKNWEINSHARLLFSFCLLSSETFSLWECCIQCKRQTAAWLCTVTIAVPNSFRFMWDDPPQTIAGVVVLRQPPRLQNVFSVSMRLPNLCTALLQEIPPLPESNPSYLTAGRKSQDGFCFYPKLQTGPKETKAAFRLLKKGETSQSRSGDISLSRK